jgi:hypothetical protein
LEVAEIVSVVSDPAVTVVGEAVMVRDGQANATGVP